MIGMRSPGECVVVNFGQKPFMFDIDQYAQVSKILTIFFLT